MARLFSLLAAAQFAAAVALAQDAVATEPGWTQRWDVWAPVILVLVLLFAIYRLRRRQGAIVDPTPPQATRLDPEH